MALFSACASTPQASTERDREANNFETQPSGIGTIYVYRTDFPVQGDDSVLWLNGRLIGATPPQTYFHIYVNPGTQYLSSSAADNGTLHMETRPGEIHFVRLQVLAGRSRLSLSTLCGRVRN